MADFKISELTAANTIAALDYFVVVQSGNTKKISSQVLFSNIPTNPTCKETIEIISSGVVSNSLRTTVINSIASSDINFSLAAGIDGTEKEILVSGISATHTATVSVPAGIGFTSILFSSIGQTVTLKFISSSWYIMSIKGATIA